MFSEDNLRSFSINNDCSVFAFVLRAHEIKSNSVEYVVGKVMTTQMNEWIEPKLNSIERWKDSEKKKSKKFKANPTEIVSVGPPSSAWPKSESRNSVLRSRSRSCVDDESRERVWSHDNARSRSRSRLRSLLRRWTDAVAANNGWIMSFPDSSRSGLRPCWARYKSALLMRFWGGGVKWFLRSSGNSHGNEVDVCDWKRFDFGN